MGLKPLIMIVDDDVINIKALESIFHQDYRIVPRKSGEQALKYFSSIGFSLEDCGQEDSDVAAGLERSRASDTKPDVILLDIVMPGIDGYEVCDRIKSNKHLKDIPVLFISGRIEPADITRGFEIGAVDYIIKPFNAAELRARVNTHLSLKNARENLAEKNLLLERQMQEIVEKTEALRQKDIQLLKMDRITGIGSLAAGLAHEVNNPLGFLKSSVFSLKKNCAKMIDFLAIWDQQPAEELNKDAVSIQFVDLSFVQLRQAIEGNFDRITRGIERISKIINSLRNFSRLDMEKESALDINAALDNAVEILLSKDIPVTIERDYSTLPPLVCMTDEINQGFMHVIKNALDAVGEEGIIRLATYYNPDDLKIVIKIADNGPGMPEDVRKQVFHPFFTTKPVGKGTGVGLTIAEQIIKKHRGEIEIESMPGEGATVVIHLPVPTDSPGNF